MWLTERCLNTGDILLKSKPSLISLSIQLYGVRRSKYTVLSFQSYGMDPIVPKPQNQASTKAVEQLPRIIMACTFRNERGVTIRRSRTINQIPRILKEGNPRTWYVSMTGKVLLTDAQTTPDVSALPHLKDMSSDSWRSVHCRP